METTTLTLGARGSSARMSCVQTFTSPTLTACIQSTWRLRDKKIPLFLVNARLSDRSYRGYKRFSCLFRQLFASFSGVGAQNAADGARLGELGCRPEAVQVVGSLKFDAAKLDERRLLDVPAMLRQIGVPEGARLLVCGSTHEGEEAILGGLFLRLRRKYPDLFLVVVPRHFERGKAAGKDLRGAGVNFVFRSEITVNTRFEPGQVECLLVNTTGELRYFYEQAAVIFVGKSLCGEGGQNPIEPAALGKAIVFGPNMQNFAPIADAFLKQQGAVQVRNPAELERTLEELFGDERRRAALGQNALRVVRENRGAIERTVELIVKHLPEGELFVAPQW